MKSIMGVATWFTGLLLFPEISPGQSAESAIFLITLGSAWFGYNLNKDDL